MTEKYKLEVDSKKSQIIQNAVNFGPFLEPYRKTLFNMHFQVNGFLRENTLGLWQYGREIQHPHTLVTRLLYNIVWMAGRVVVAQLLPPNSY